jgi:hypothetical protein
MFGPKGSQTPADFVVEFNKVLGSKLTEEPDTGERPTVLYYVQGAVGDMDLTGDEPTLDMTDQAGEVDEETDVYGSIGLIARPLEPETYNSREYYAEVVCLKTSDGLVPISGRDLRIQMPGNAPNVGTIALAGYGGGFLSMDPVDSTKPEDSYDGTVMVWYSPYDFNAAGVAQKAHSVTLDPTPGNESMSFVHGSGAALTIADTGEIVIKNTDGSSYIGIDSTGITMTGTINLAGGVVVGNAALAVPMLAGPASPPCSTLFVSP